ncbi:Hypothetical protein A7982_05437 [Minicystis rosea]|nr:Hypothetical protein A7982_05437 [Minicystis rosea]
MVDQDEIARRAAGALDGDPSLVFLSFPSPQDPRAKAHTCEVVTTVDPRAFRRWTGTRWMKRGEDYEALKARMSEGSSTSRSATCPVCARSSRTRGSGGRGAKIEATPVLVSW